MIPNFPGCLWSMHKWYGILYKRNKIKLHVVWLDLTKAYGSVPNQLILMALNFSFSLARLGKSKWNTSTQLSWNSLLNCTTKWKVVEIGIMMGCVISLLFFVLAMEMILRGVSITAKGVMAKEQLVLPPSRAFMDDITILVSSKIAANNLLQIYQNLFTWARLRQRPRKVKASH